MQRDYSQTYDHARRLVRRDFDAVASAYNAAMRPGRKKRAPSSAIERSLALYLVRVCCNASLASLARVGALTREGVRRCCDGVEDRRDLDGFDVLISRLEEELTHVSSDAILAE